MEFLSQYALFLSKTTTVAVAILLVFAGILALRHKGKPDLEIVPLNKEYEDLKRTLSKEITGKAPKKKKASKNEEKPTLFVLEFNGDMKASQVEQLREEITAVLSIATTKDEVLIKLDSPGGMVNGYGLAASQLQRVRDRHIPLTVCIDKIAASGGYLMACVANHIVAAPFAIVGSIGVVAQMPNFHRWLKKNDIDVELLTAGEYKRTLTMLGENTEKGREKFQEDLEKIHAAFRNYILANRAQINIEEVATGEHWLAKDAYALKLIDALATSDDYLINKLDMFNAFKISIPEKPSVMNKLLKPAARLVDFLQSKSGFQA
jgi:serine protease SohB